MNHEKLVQKAYTLFFSSLPEDVTENWYEYCHDIPIPENNQMYLQGYVDILKLAHHDFSKFDFLGNETIKYCSEINHLYNSEVYKQAMETFQEQGFAKEFEKANDIMEVTNIIAGLDKEEELYSIIEDIEFKVKESFMRNNNMDLLDVKIGYNKDSDVLYCSTKIDLPYECVFFEGSPVSEVGEKGAIKELCNEMKNLWNIEPNQSRLEKIFPDESKNAQKFQDMFKP